MKDPTEYIYTYSGRRIDLDNFTEKDISLDDIAYGLAGINRFNGQTRISVLRHSIAVAEICGLMGCSNNTYLQALLHDASEAYVMDVPVPLKLYMTPRWTWQTESVQTIIEDIFMADQSDINWELINTIDKGVVVWEMGSRKRHEGSRMNYPIDGVKAPKCLQQLGELQIQAAYHTEEDDYELIAYFTSRVSTLSRPLAAPEIYAQVRRGAQKASEYHKK